MASDFSLPFPPYEPVLPYIEASRAFLDDTTAVEELARRKTSRSPARAVE